jgi:protein tyrosine phosphatase (PTP) superfamily phosphohydrolase (DUF442 family)
MGQLSNIRSFLPISEAIATAGQPTAEEFETIRAAGYQVVINLALPSSNYALPDEAAIAAAQGLEYIAIPVVWETPTLADLEQFFAIMQARQGQAIFVHCAMNMRVSVFMYLYRVLCQGVDDAEARQSLHQIWMPNPIWQGFIEQALQHYR